MTPTPLADRFMQRVLYKDRFFEVDTDLGTEWLDQELIGKTTNPTHSALQQYLEGTEIYSVTVVDGWGAYLSAPGYLDRTSLVVFNRKQDAEAYLREIDSE